ncbi:MAG: hypothetical protein ACLQAH_18100 [Limisphaerales bacterium]
MGFLSDIVSEPLMKWREPNAYVRKNLSRGRWIVLLIVLLIAPVGLAASFWSDHHLSKGRIILISFFTGIGTLAFVRTWFGPGDVVCLKEDHITDGVGRSADRSQYRNIEYCDVSHDNYNGTKFSVLRFSVRKGLPAGQVKEVAVPDEVNLEHILQILRDKGVKVVEEQAGLA